MFLSLAVPAEPDEKALARQNAFLKQIGLSDVDQASLKTALKTFAAAHSAWEGLQGSDGASPDAIAKGWAIVQDTRDLLTNQLTAAATSRLFQYVTQAKVRMSKSYRLLILGVVMIAASAKIQAQGFYDNESTDFDFNLYTSLMSYGSDNCGSPYMTSTLNGNYAVGSSVYQTIYSGTAGIDYSWDFSYNQPFYAGGCQLGSVKFSWPIGYAITYTQSLGLYSDAFGNCAQQNACTNGSPKCSVTSVKEAVTGMVPCDIWHETLTVVLAGSCRYGLSNIAGGPGVPCRNTGPCDSRKAVYSLSSCCRQSVVRPMTVKRPKNCA